jgi:hypothetical protein
MVAALRPAPFAPHLEQAADFDGVTRPDNAALMQEAPTGLAKSSISRTASVALAGCTK